MSTLLENDDFCTKKSILTLLSELPNCIFATKMGIYFIIKSIKKSRLRPKNELTKYWKMTILTNFRTKIRYSLIFRGILNSKTSKNWVQKIKLNYFVSFS